MKFVEYVGDVNSMEYSGKFYFEDEGDITVLEVKNVNEYFGKSALDGIPDGNEETVKVTEVTLDPDDLDENTLATLEAYSGNPEMSRTQIVGTYLDYFGVQEVDPVYFPSYAETARYLLDIDPENEALYEVLGSYLEDGHVGKETYFVTVAVEAYNEDHAARQLRGKYDVDNVSKK